ncbi:hypothetical protein [Halovulum sp. GXIMD14793]
MNLLGDRPLHRKLQALLKQLKAERALLLQGRIAALTDLLPKLTALTSEIEALELVDDPRTMDLLTRVQTSAQRNQGLAEASLRGLEAAKRKLRQIDEAQAQLNTYTGAGQRREIVGSAPTREKRS